MKLKLPICCLLIASQIAVVANPRAEDAELEAMRRQLKTLEAAEAADVARRLESEKKAEAQRKLDAEKRKKQAEVTALLGKMSGAEGPMTPARQLEWSRRALELAPQNEQVQRIAALSSINGWIAKGEEQVALLSDEIERADLALFFALTIARSGDLSEAERRIGLLPKVSGYVFEDSGWRQLAAIVATQGDLSAAEQIARRVVDANQSRLVYGHLVDVAGTQGKMVDARRFFDLARSKNEAFLRSLATPNPGLEVETRVQLWRVARGARLQSEAEQILAEGESLIPSVPHDDQGATYSTIAYAAIGLKDWATAHRYAIGMEHLPTIRVWYYALWNHIASFRAAEGDLAGAAESLRLGRQRMEIMKVGDDGMDPDEIDSEPSWRGMVTHYVRTSRLDDAMRLIRADPGDAYTDRTLQIAEPFYWVVWGLSEANRTDDAASIARDVKAGNEEQEVRLARAQLHGYVAVAIARTKGVLAAEAYIEKLLLSPYIKASIFDDVAAYFGGKPRKME
ncbi:MAG: hypothetical protein AB7Q01_08220 [Gammaproteobacteria bacterium]